MLKNAKKASKFIENFILIAAKKKYVFKQNKSTDSSLNRKKANSGNTYNFNSPAKIE